MVNSYNDFKRIFLFFLLVEKVRQKQQFVVMIFCKEKNDH
jgi:hypothetical protein